MAGRLESHVNRRFVGEFVERQAAAMSDGEIVLDAGAGEGRYGPLFSRQHYFAIDLAVGDAKWDYGGLDVLADLGALPFRAECADHVLSTQTLEHLCEPGRFLAEAYRVLRPGGVIHVTAPQCFRLHQVPHDYYRYTRYGMAYILERAGFVEVVVTPQGGYFHCLLDIIRPLHRRLFGRERSLAWRIASAPIALLSRIILKRIVPFAFYRLDHLDERKAMTTGHEATARKPLDG